MKARSVLSEAWRDTVTGTSRAALFAVVFVLAIGGMALLDIRSIVTTLQDAATFEASGAAVHVLQSNAAIDGKRCDNLGHTNGIAASGAIRQGQPLTLWALPSSQITTVEVTPGIIAMLPMIAQPASAGDQPDDGIWLSADLAESLGAKPGATVRTSDGVATVAGVYTWPDDGRARDLGYTIVTPVPADGTFSQCWAQIWPDDSQLPNLVFMSLTSIDPNMQNSFGQLNSTLGIAYDAKELLADRTTRYAPWIAGLIGLALGYAAVRLRRLEIASSLHARVPRADLTWQHLIEAVLWTCAGVLICACGLVWPARAGNPDPSWATWLIGMRTVAAGGCAALIGTVIGVTTTREKHLFRYTKDR